MFPIKNVLKPGDALSSFLLNFFFVEYAIRRVYANRKGFKLNRRQQVLLFADDININILGGSVKLYKQNTQSLLVASREIGLEVDCETTNRMVCAQT
jgi:hypothetical protein